MSAPSLEELRRVIRRIESRGPPRPAPESVDSVVGGEVQETGEGPILVVRRDYPLGHRHGRLTLSTALEAPLDAMSRVARAEVPLADARRLLFLDTETTGLAGGTGTYAFLVGTGRVEGDRFVVTQYFMRDLDEEPALLASLAPLVAGASGLVTFNGTGFDLPLLETRFVLARRRWPSPLPHLDLLRPARRVWGGSLPDCRLATLESEVIGLSREDDVPGSLIPSLYFDYLRSRRARPLARVFAHNRDDILSLVGLLGWFGRAVADEPRGGRGAEEWLGLGRLWEPFELDRSLACYRAALDGGLDGTRAQWTRLRLAAWEKRAARWHAARALWEAAQAADVFDPRPWEELAKYHEHRVRDLTAARTVVEGALDSARAAGVATRVLDAFAYRLDRLNRRLERDPGRR